MDKELLIKKLENFFNTEINIAKSMISENNIQEGIKNIHLETIKDIKSKAMSIVRLYGDF